MNERFTGMECSIIEVEAYTGVVHKVGVGDELQTDHVGCGDQGIAGRAVTTVTVCNTTIPNHKKLHLKSNAMENINNGNGIGPSSPPIQENYALAIDFFFNSIQQYCYQYKTVKQIVCMTK